MKFFAGAFALALAIAQVVAQGQPLLNTPNGVSQCLNTVLTWTGGTGPYILTVNPGGQPSAAPLRQLGSQTGTSFSWKCDIAAGQSIFFRLRDSTGLLSETAAVTVLPGTDATCLNGNSTSSTTGGATTAPPATTQQTTANPNPGSTPSNTGTAPGTNTNTGTAGTPKPTGAANGLTVNAGLAGIVALGAALFA